MKKISLMLLAGSALFASCTPEPTGSTDMSQAQIDSAVNAIVAEREAEMYASNDSLIMAMATMRADSMMAAQKGQTIPGRTTTRTTPPKTTKPSTPAAPTTKDGRLNTDGATKTNNDGRLNTDGATKKNNDGRLKTD